MSLLILLAWILHALHAPAWIWAVYGLLILETGIRYSLLVSRGIKEMRDGKDTT